MESYSTKYYERGKGLTNGKFGIMKRVNDSKGVKLDVVKFYAKKNKNLYSKWEYFAESCKLCCIWSKLC